MRISRLLATSCAIAAISPVLLPTVAVNAAAGERVVYVADLVGSDSAYGLYTTTNFGGSPSTVIAENGILDVAQAEISPDGTQIAALVDSAGTFDYSLQVMNIDGAHRRTVLAATHNSTAQTSTVATGFSWAADSSSLVFSKADFSPSATSAKLRRYTVATGAIADVTGGGSLTDPAVAPNGTIAAVDAAGALILLDSAGTRTSTGVVGTNTDFIETPSWSADGTSIVYVDDSATDTADRSTINVITVSGGTWSAPTLVAPATSGANTWWNEYPTFDSDGTIWFDRFDDTTNPGASGDILTATKNGSTWDLVSHATTPSDGSISFGALDAQAPVAPTLQAFTLAGTTTYLNWTTTDVDVSKLNVHRTGSDGSSVDFVAGGSPYADKTTKLGVTYTYSATATDGVGNTGPSSATRTVTASGVKVVVSNPTSLSTAKLPFSVSWGVAGNQGVIYTVQYATSGGAVKTFQQATTATKGTVSSPTAGQTYLFRGQVKDGYGNSSAWTAWSKAAVPFDQSKGTFSTSPSWKLTHSTADWLGSIKTTTHNKATVTFKLTSRGVQIIGDKLPAGAKFAVYVGKAYKGTFSTHAATTKHRQVLYSVSFASLATRTIKIVAVVASGKTLKIDGVAAPK